MKIGRDEWKWKYKTLNSKYHIQIALSHVIIDETI